MARLASIPVFAVPYVRLFRRLFAGAGELSSIAARRNIIWPEETVAARPAICLPGQIDRIVDRAPNSPSPNEKEIAQITSATLTHGATIAYHIKDATLFDGCIYTKNFKYPIAKSRFIDRQVKSLFTWGVLHWPLRIWGQNFLVIGWPMTVPATCSAKR